MDVDGQGKACTATNAFHVHALRCGAGGRAPATRSALVGCATGLSAGNVDPAGNKIEMSFSVIVVRAAAITVLVVLRMAETGLTGEREGQYFPTKIALKGAPYSSNYL